MVRFRGRVAKSSSTPGAFDGGVDEELWRKLSRALLAAQRGDPSTYVTAVNELTGGLELDRLRLLSLYVAHLLEYRIRVVLGRRPVETDVVALSNRVRFEFHQFIPESAGLLEETVRTGSRLPNTDGSALKGGEFQVRAMIVLALLIDDPSVDLIDMRAALGRYCALHQESIRRVCQKGSPSEML